MDSYTPHSHTHVGTAGRKKKIIGLSQKEYSKVTTTIASSVRRSTSHGGGQEELEMDAHFERERQVDLHREDRRPSSSRLRTASTKVSKSKSSHPRDAHQDASFIAETSFVRAPLNSRVVSSSGLGVSISSGGLGVNSAYRDHGHSSGKGKSRDRDHTGDRAEREKAKGPEPLNKMPLNVQEAFVLEDLLFVLMGIEGTYITYHSDYSPEDDDPLLGIRFVVSGSLDSSLADLVERILPLGMYYTAIHAFIEQRSHLDYGLVNHALCAAIREMLRDYQTLLSQLEHAFNTSPTFTLQKLWFYVHPTIHTLSLIYQLVLELGASDDDDDDDDANVSASGSSVEEEEDEEEAARNEALGLGGAKLKAVLSEMKHGVSSTPTSLIPVIGGEVLSIIYERMQNLSGDPTAREVYAKLLRAAERPYVGMIRDWVSAGRLKDTYEEMVVKESKFIDRGILDVDYTDEYWERRYTLRDGSVTPGSAKRLQTGIPSPRKKGRMPGGSCVPPLLESWKFKILLAGKYLNVIRECGIEIPRETGDNNGEGLSMDDERFYAFIQEAYSHANRTLLSLLLKDQQLIPRLRAFKRFFFLSQSAFLTHFLDLSASELRKPAKSVSEAKLQNLLEIALNADADAAGDEGVLFGKDLKVIMAESGLYDFLLKVVTVTGAIKEGGDGDEDPAKDNAKEKEKEKDKKSIQAIDALAFDYTVKFPLSLVISRKTILRYQLLFRFLLHLKHVEQALGAMWIEQKSAPWRVSLASYGPQISTGLTPSSSGQSQSSSHTHVDSPPATTRTTTPTTTTPPPPATTTTTTNEINPSHHFRAEFSEWRLRVCILRARMLSVIQQLLAFLTFEVLDPNWAKLEDKLKSVDTVDALLRDHVDFLDGCLKEGMLTSGKMLKACSKLIVVCQTFALYSSSFTKSVNQALAAAQAFFANHEISSNGGEKPVFVDPSRAKRWDVLNKFEANFNHWFQVHLDCVQFYASSDNVSLLPLVVRLNSVKSA